MENSNSGREAADEVVGGLKKDFTVVGKQRVHAWYAWAIVGIVFGMALGIVYVANRSAQFDASQAAGPAATAIKRMACPSTKDKSTSGEGSATATVDADKMKFFRYSATGSNTIITKDGSEKDAGDATAEEIKYFQSVVDEVQAVIDKTKGNAEEACKKDLVAKFAAAKTGESCGMSKARVQCDLTINPVEPSAICEYVPSDDPAGSKIDYAAGSYTAVFKSPLQPITLSCVESATPVIRD